MQAVKLILAASGQSLRYSRKTQSGGYYIEGSPELAPQVTRAIHGDAQLDPRQIAVFGRLTPSQRLRLAARLTADLLTIAVGRLQQERPKLTRLEAQREVLHRAYQLPG